MRYIVFDIETAPLTETAYLWTPKDEKEFPPIDVHKIVTIGWMVIDIKAKPEVSMHAVHLSNGAEYNDIDSSILAKATDYITMYGREFDLVLKFVQDIIINRQVTQTTMEFDNFCFVSQHGTKFDLAVILSRCFSHSIRTDWYYGYYPDKFTNPESKIKRPLHIDIKHEFADGMFKGHSLDNMSQMAGLTGKGEVDGSKVFDMYNAGRHLDIAQYCLTDVTKTALVFLRHCLLSSCNDSWSYINLAMDEVRLAIQKASILPAMTRLEEQTDWKKYRGLISRD